MGAPCGQDHVTRPVVHAVPAETEVLEGLNDGDEVILYPGDRIRDGLRVRVVKM